MLLESVEERGVQLPGPPDVSVPERHHEMVTPQRHRDRSAQVVVIVLHKTTPSRVFAARRCVDDLGPSGLERGVTLRSP